MARRRHDVPSSRPPLVVCGIGDGKRRRSGSEQIGNQGFVVPPDLKIHLPLVIRRPMPIQHVFTLGVPIPFYPLPQHIRLLRQDLLLGIPVLEIFPDANEGLTQQGGFHQVPAVVIRAEWNDGTGISIHPVRPGAMETIGIPEKIQGRIQVRHPI